MPPLPARFAAIILTFAPLFVQRSWRHTQVLLVGAILTPGRRTVASLLRVTGHARERRFVDYHRVLSRAAWSPRAGGRILLGLLISAFAPRGPVVLALDDPTQIVCWFVRRWSVEVTFQEVRAHLGVETQRQWSDKAIARSTPCLLALFSIVTLLATRLRARERRRIAAAAWYAKARPTFVDALAAVRHAIWREQGLVTSPRQRHPTKRRFVLPAPWAYILCHAA